MLTSIAGRSVLVTGGSKGIGKGIARVFARQGAKVMIAARGAEEGAAAAAELAAEGATVRFRQTDVSDWAEVQALVAETLSAFGGLDTLCANAGIYPKGSIEELSPEGWDQVIDVNLKSTFLSVKAAIPALRDSGRGRIVITSSITGPITGSPGWTHYGASKSGQLGFMRTAALELVGSGITVNAVLPGNIYVESMGGWNAAELEAIAASVPMGKMGKVEDIANAALFFASDEAAYITGQTIVVDGGQILPEYSDEVTA